MSKSSANDNGQAWRPGPVPEGTFRAIGLMSGTSLDGIDIALIETDGETRVMRGPRASVAYPETFRADLKAAIADAKGLTDRTSRPGRLAQIEQDLTRRHVDAVLAFMGQHGIEPAVVDCIGFHGQTVLHRPEIGVTVQLGDGAGLAKATGVDVVYDLRAADCAAGGQGAPLVPVYHRAIVAHMPQRPVAIVNIGGVANITWIGRDGRLIAFDTGPGNALIDDWMLARTNQAYDKDGQAAANGRVESRAVTAYLNYPYFSHPPPKSLDRDAFPIEIVEGFSVNDGAATLTDFTAASIAKAREHLPEEPELWIIAGGGARNKTLMSMLAGRVETAVAPAEMLGFDGAMLEAEAWAYLAVRSLKRLPITFPGTTGAPEPMSGGVIARA